MIPLILYLKGNGGFSIFLAKIISFTNITPLGNKGDNFNII